MPTEKCERFEVLFGLKEEGKGWGGEGFSAPWERETGSGGGARFASLAGEEKKKKVWRSGSLQGRRKVRIFFVGVRGEWSAGVLFCCCEWGRKRENEYYREKKEGSFRGGAQRCWKCRTGAGACWGGEGASSLEGGGYLLEKGRGEGRYDVVGREGD